MPPEANRTPRSARIEARIAPDALAVVRRAAELQGRSVSDFVVAAAEAAAHRTIAEVQIIRLSVEDQRAFAAAILDPPEPAPALAAGTTPAVTAVSFRIEPLGAAHDRKGFCCGVAALDRYLHELATQDIRRRISNCFVACDPAGTVAAYYTFAATGFPLADLPAEEAKRLPRYGMLPAGLIGRLAVDQRFRGRRLGGGLVIDAARRAAGGDPAIFALVVDAKDEAAAAFYRHLGFRPFVSRPMTLFLPVATALRAVRAAAAAAEGA